MGRLFIWTILFAVTVGELGAQEPNCGEIAAIAEMARAKSMPALVETSRRAGENYRQRLVFAYRSFQLNSRNRPDAERLLALIPAGDAEQLVVMTLGDSLCDKEMVTDMKALASVGDGLARELARAVMLAPNFLSAYVSYSLVAVGDPHSDFAVQMRRVCRHKHAGFIEAVKQLPPATRQFFAGHVMNPEGCTVLALPESD
ncbi:MAG: hypothetical protein ACLQGV_18255 [Bryobacteraceae bacterium]